MADKSLGRIFLMWLWRAWVSGSDKAKDSMNIFKWFINAHVLVPCRLRSRVDHCPPQRSGAPRPSLRGSYGSGQLRDIRLERNCENKVFLGRFGWPSSWHFSRVASEMFMAARGLIFFRCIRNVSENRELKFMLEGFRKQRRNIMDDGVSEVLGRGILPSYVLVGRQL